MTVTAQPGVTVRLTDPERTLAALVGTMRQFSALERGRPSGHGYDERDPWNTHVEGAAAELAVAKHLLMFWWAAPGGKLADNPADIGADIEVRSTDLPNGRLIVHPSDPGDHFYFLVVRNAPPDYRIAGWMLGREAKNRDRYWCDPGTGRPAFFVPQADLKPVPV